MDRFFQNPTSNQIQECRRLPASVLRGAPTCDVRRVQTAGLGDENQEEHPERAEVEGQAGISSVLWWDPLSGSLLCWFLISNFPQTRFHRDVLLHSDGEHQPGAAIFHKTETAPMKEREKKKTSRKNLLKCWENWFCKWSETDQIPPRFPGLSGSCKGRFRPNSLDVKRDFL